LARLPGREFPGKVTRIADALQPGTRTLLTEIDIPNPDSALSPGTYCTIGGLRRAIPFLLVGSDEWRKSSTLYGTKRSCRHAYCLDKPGKRGLA
jgi:multidrug efflux pump subunit AcrA (membrane-fusion protein)